VKEFAEAIVVGQVARPRIGGRVLRAFALTFNERDVVADGFERVPFREAERAFELAMTPGAAEKVVVTFTDPS